MGLINPYNGLLINGGNMGSALGIVDGNAGAPGLYFNNSPTTGIYRAGANIIGFSTAGVGRAFFTATGRFVLGNGIADWVAFQVLGTLTAVAGVGIGAWVTPGITASANADVLTGIIVNPVFADGGFVNVVHRAISNLGTGTIYTLGPVQIDINSGLMLGNQVTGAGVGAGTLLNAPAAGNPAFWLPVVINAVTRYIPCW